MTIPTKEEILAQRKEIEADLSELLKETGSDFGLEDIKTVIYNEQETDDMQDVIMMLDDGNPENLSNVIETVTDAWNYFPHKILNGLCPMEKILEHQEKQKHK
jgi:hypothetical protein